MGVTTKQELLRLETVSSNLSKNQVSVWSSPDKSVSRLCHELKNYLSFRPNPHSKGVGAMQQNWSVQLGHILYACPLFSLIPRALHRVQDQVQTMMLVVPVWQTQPWYPRLLYLLIAYPIIIPHRPNLLLNAQKEVHPLVANKTLRLATWKVSGNPLLIRGYQSRQSVLSPVLEG